MRKTLSYLASAALAITCLSCSSVDLPKGSSRGYTSARLVRANPNRTEEFADKDVKLNRMIQKSLGQEFRNHGLRVDPNNGELIVAYLILIQDNSSTLALDDYFGYNSDFDAIVDRAQIKGVVENKRPDVFQAGTVVIDVMDAKTNKLVFRNYATRDIYKNISDSTRQQRVHEAVAAALQPFFK